MRIFGWLIAACIVIALMRVLLALVAVLVIVGILACLFYRPRETLGLCLIVAAASQPLTALELLALTCVAGLIGKAIER